MKIFLNDRLFLEDNSIELNDFYFIKEISNGNSGKIALVYCKKNSFFYTIKIIKKKNII